MDEQERRRVLPAMSDLIQGRLYRTRARAAETMADGYSYSIWNGDAAFVGIRTKFNSRFVEAELHWDANAMFGTVREALDTGIDCPIVVGWTADQWIEAWTSNALFQWLDERSTELGGVPDRRSRCFQCRQLYAQQDVAFSLLCSACVPKRETTNG